MNLRYEAWLQALDQRDNFMISLFILAALALGYYLLLVRGNKVRGWIALVIGVGLFYGSLLALLASI